MCGYLWALVEASVPDEPSLELLFVPPYGSVFSISSVLSLSGIHPALLAYLCQLRGGGEKRILYIVIIPAKNYGSNEIKTFKDSLIACRQDKDV